MRRSIWLLISRSPTPTPTQGRSIALRSVRCSKTRLRADRQDHKLKQPRIKAKIRAKRVCMRDFDENNITDAVIEQFRNTPDQRLKQILVSLVKHLHAFAREVRLSFDEWSYAVDFLTRTGTICTAERPEF